jgi:hypothetical protein
MIRRIVLFLVCFVFVLATAKAQSNYALVRGSVLDPQHRPIASAHVRMTATETGTERQVVSNASGLYEIAGLQPGA